MKSILRIIAEKLLGIRAKQVLRKHPKIIGITGSIGKTSTRKAIADVLAAKYRVSSSPENFNTPMGLLLSILEIPATGKSAFDWIKIIFHAFFSALPDPEVILLEYGVDSPGDMDKLLKIVVPEIAVLTPVTQAHMDAGQFQSIAEIRTEKLKLARAANQVIANLYDYETVRILKAELSEKTVFFGGVPDIEYSLSDTTITDLGISFSLGKNYYFAPVYGKFQAQVFSPAIILGTWSDVPNDIIKHVISRFQPPPGRGRILGGKNNSTIWDFSYNSSPVAAMAALKALPEIPGFSRKIVLLGTMNELGEKAVSQHEQLGRTAAENADEILFVGKYREAFEKGVAEQKPVYTFQNAHVAGVFLQGFLEEYDFLLVKGSQNGVFLEAAIEAILVDPRDADLLCRRSPKWDIARKQAFNQ